MLQLVALQVLLGGEALVACVAAERALARVGQHVALDVGRVVGRVAAQVARVLLLHQRRAPSAAADHRPRDGRERLPVAAAPTVAGHRHKADRRPCGDGRWKQHHGEKACCRGCWERGRGGGRGGLVGKRERGNSLLTSPVHLPPHK